jgi:D-inositol-3-phosphate glycosyltransferase
MISFVWSAKYPFLAGAGGSENYTAGHVRELLSRGIPSRVIVIGHNVKASREGFPDIPFISLATKEELAALDDTLVFVTYPLRVNTKRQSFVILHCPPPSKTYDPMYDRAAFRGKKLIAPSRYSARMWRNYLGNTMQRIHIVNPFAEEHFSRVRRQAHPRNLDTVRMLFAGRLIADKGIYTLLTALHMPELLDKQVELVCTTAGAHTPHGKIIHKLLKAHPMVKLVPAAFNAADMSELIADFDLVVMPTTDIFWKETFGIVSVEAQHAGCRVVASRAGGLPETNCGGLLLVEPDDPSALAKGIAKAAALGPLTATERRLACKQFTRKVSADSLLKLIHPKQQKLPLRREAGLLPHLNTQLGLLGGHLKSPAYVGERSAGK